MMMFRFAIAVLLPLASVSAAPSPVVTPDPSLDETLTRRAGACLYSGVDGYAQAIQNKKSCTSITLSGLSVPGGKTLDLTGLTSGTQVEFFAFC